MYAKASVLPGLPSPSLPPPLKWAGGKRWLVPRLCRIWSGGHPSRRLVEPFVGGLAVVLGLLPRTALLNDSNPHLISFYKWLQYGLEPDGVTFKNDRATFYANRSRFNELIEAGKADSAEAAALFYYLNRTGYNGLCRFNGSGLFNVPFGSYKVITYRTGREFAEYRSALRAYDFRCGDFADLVLRNDDLVYADPPYDVEFTSYSAGGFDFEDQKRLAKWLAKHSGPVVASNQATKRILQMYRSLGFAVMTLAAPRRISCDGNREDVREMLATLNL
ncbi:MAG: Dam family site-specific DNA-(adenine-N6)-methyltransferase [Candidatus Eremiobacteraeota bacterium]|nr:Dam family site-specific DNA-(adenine-N6)-methyltransferase [Candidatus Eremiobacteraeota bacterium]